MNLPDFSFEQSLLPPGTRYLLGLDEVGRGPWAGPVAVGAFLLDLTSFNPEVFIKLKVRDSKTLSPSQRQQIYDSFQHSRYRFSVFSATSQEIDSQGISLVINQLFSQALKFYENQFDFALLDGNINLKSFSPSCQRGGRGEIVSLVKADQKCFSVAAASIVAKVSRNHQMDYYDSLFPQYGFSSHQGYGTAAHLAALKLHGICPIHRLSYKPISQFI